MKSIAPTLTLLSILFSNLVAFQPIRTNANGPTSSKPIAIRNDSSARQTQQEKPEPITPVEIDYRRLAFYPDRWNKAGLNFDMLAWKGKNIVFLTTPGKYDGHAMTSFVNKLDQGWDVYREMTGTQPRSFKQIDSKATICAIPRPDLSCGYGCGYVGSTGIEVSAFYRKDWSSFQKNRNDFQHYYFYEMGRNNFVFGDRHSLFTTGYAVFMRYVCMDRLKCVDSDLRTRKIIESCEEIYADSDLSFYDAFTNLGTGEKRSRLKDERGRVISPSDQPVMYATAMLKLRRDYGGDEWVKKFYHRLRECNPRPAKDIASAQVQTLNWLVSASAAAGKDLSNVFADRWRMPLSNQQREIMSSTKWSNPKLKMKVIVDSMLAVRKDCP